MGGHHHGGSGNESAAMKFFVSGTVAVVFEGFMGGHYLEFLKINKQTSNLSYMQITKNMVQHKGLIGVLDGFFPWGFVQCFVKGASFGYGQVVGYNLLKGKVDDSYAEVISGGIGGGFQGIVMSPLLLLKTRVMTNPALRQSGGLLATTLASAKVGVQVVQNEGISALMKGSLVFSSKRVVDWTSRYLFAELVSNSMKSYKAKKQDDPTKKVELTNTEKMISSFLGGALSAILTIPMDVLVASIQDNSKAGQKVGVLQLWKERLASGGIKDLIQYSCRGTVARIVHVGATTVLMKSASSLVYDALNAVKK